MEFTNKMEKKQHVNIEEIKSKTVKDFIPCLLIKCEQGSSKIFVYFHANAEDLGRATRFIQYIHAYLKMHILAVEYPGYGLYKGDFSNSDKIMKDAEVVYKFIV